LIAGGESGSGLRVMQDVLAIELRKKCKAEGIGFFFKQHSAFKPVQGQLLEGVQYHESPSK
jgi:protein gp37